MPDQPDEPQQVPVNLEIELPSELEVGVFSDFASIWHTPNAFVLDFLSVKRPPVPNGDDPIATLATKVAARVRIPPEQIFPIIEALQMQTQQWLQESGRAKPPESWVPEPPADAAGTLEVGEEPTS